MEYKVMKNVTEGEFFEEHRYSKFTEHFLGKWLKAGVFVESNPSVKDLLCDYCRQDWNARRSLKPLRSKLRSYQVVGVTKPDEFWEWEQGRCANVETCWGQRDRIWDVRRSRNGERYSFNHHKLSTETQKEETVDKTYATFQRGAGNLNLEYTAIARKTSQCLDFFPNCLPLVESPKRHIFITMASKKNAPKNILQLPKNQWPMFYQTPQYLNPNRMEFRYFDEQKKDTQGKQFSSSQKKRICEEVPSSLTALENSFPEVARTYIEMYPGGSGLKVSQYKMVNQWKIEEKRETVDWLPSWWDNPYSGYIPNIQHGWKGPIVSYWCRLDSFNRTLY
jgi:hypothetical protein